MNADDLDIVQYWQQYMMTAGAVYGLLIRKSYRYWSQGFIDEYGLGTSIVCISQAYNV